MIKTVLFDLDGTLLNTIDDLADAGNWVCAQNGWPTFTVAQFKLMVGNGIPKLVERFSPADARSPAQLAATLAQFTARYDAHKEDKTAPYPGIPALLDALKAEGIQCAVFSNKADALCGGIIAHYFGTGRFDVHASAVNLVCSYPYDKYINSVHDKCHKRHHKCHYTVCKKHCLSECLIGIIKTLLFFLFTSECTYYGKTCKNFS